MTKKIIKGGSISNTIHSVYGTVVNVADATTKPLKLMRQYTFLAADTYSNNFDSIPQMYLRNLIYVLPITLISIMLIINFMPNTYRESFIDNSDSKIEIQESDKDTKIEIPVKLEKLDVNKDNHIYKEFTYKEKIIYSTILSIILGVFLFIILQLFRRNKTFKLFTGNGILHYYYLPFLIIFSFIFILLIKTIKTKKDLYNNLLISFVLAFIGSIFCSFIIRHILIEKNKLLLNKLLEVFKECPSLDIECNSIHKKFIEIFRDYIPENFHKWLENFGWHNAVNLLIQRENLEHAIAIKQMFKKNKN
jgi:hypothetical protein